MKRCWLTGVLLCLVGTSTWSGVTVVMEDSGATTDTIYAQGKMLRMDPHAGRGGAMSMIFTGDAMLLVDRDKNKCQRIDERGIERLSAELGGAMAQMQKELAKMPPEQRAMVEKMMKDRMPPGMGQQAPPRRVERGDVEQVGDYRCTVQTLYAGDEKVWEICAAERSAVSGFAEAMEAFEAMSEFTEKLRAAAMQGPFASMLQTPFSDMGSVDGVPVRVRSFSGGRQTGENVLKSVTKQEFDDAWFAAPKGCKVQDLADELKRGR